MGHEPLSLRRGRWSARRGGGVRWSGRRRRWISDDGAATCREARPNVRRPQKYCTRRLPPDVAATWTDRPRWRPGERRSLVRCRRPSVADRRDRHGRGRRLATGPGDGWPRGAPRVPRRTMSTSARPSAPPSSSAPAATAEPVRGACPRDQPRRAPDARRPAFDKSAMSIDDPASLWVVSDKLRPLSPIDYVPSDLVTIDVASQNPPVFRAEAAATRCSPRSRRARRRGPGQFQVQSAYRSYATQVSVYGAGSSGSGRRRPTSRARGPGTASTRPGSSPTSARSR